VNEDELRAIVRETLARLASREQSPADAAAARPLNFTAHVSHYQYTLPPSGGPCFIEPGVSCIHCGYCQSHGH
jgi:hypothetical protein